MWMRSTLQHTVFFVLSREASQAGTLGLYQHRGHSVQLHSCQTDVALTVAACTEMADALFSSEVRAFASFRSRWARASRHGRRGWQERRNACRRRIGARASAAGAAKTAPQVAAAGRDPAGHRAAGRCGSGAAHHPAAARGTAVSAVAAGGASACGTPCAGRAACAARAARGRSPIAAGRAARGSRGAERRASAAVMLTDCIATAGVVQPGHPRRRRFRAAACERARRLPRGRRRARRRRGWRRRTQARAQGLPPLHAPL